MQEMYNVKLLSFINDIFEKFHKSDFLLNLKKTENVFFLLKNRAKCDILRLNKIMTKNRKGYLLDKKLKTIK